MNKLGWFMVGVLVAMSISTIADEGVTPDESRLRDLAGMAEKSTNIRIALDELKRDAVKLQHAINYRQSRGIWYEL